MASTAATEALIGQGGVLGRLSGAARPEAVTAKLDQLMAEFDAAMSAFEDQIEAAVSPPGPVVAAGEGPAFCAATQVLLTERQPTGRGRGDRLAHQLDAAVDATVERWLTAMGTILVADPELYAGTPGDVAEAIPTIRIPPFAYLRAMWNLFWSATRHPLADTTIELSTGRVLYHT